MICSCCEWARNVPHRYAIVPAPLGIDLNREQALEEL